MNARRTAAVAAIVIGLIIVGTQLFRGAPWQLGIALGITIAFFGVIALAEDDDEEDDERTYGSGGDVRPLAPRDGA